MHKSMDYIEKYIIVIYNKKYNMYKLYIYFI